MYCVVCGTALSAANQMGLACRSCRRRHRVREKRARKRSGRLPIQVQYCFRCGEPYRPHDRSISHQYHLYDFLNQPANYQGEREGAKQDGRAYQERSGTPAGAD